MNRYLTTIKDFSKASNLSISVVKKMASTKRLPCFKLGHRIVRIITDYDSFIESLPDYLSIKAAAFEIGVSYVTLDRYLSNRTLITVSRRNENGSYVQQLAKSEIINLVNKGYDS